MSLPSTETQTASVGDHGYGQYLTFTLDGETYAVDVNNAQTVIENVAVTRIPRTPDYVLGVIDFRGSAIPLIDLRKTLGLKGRSESEGENENSATNGSVVVIMEVPRETDRVVLAATVDEVEEVIQLRRDEIGEAPELGLNADLSFVEGIAREGDQLFLVLNAARILDRDDLAALSATAAATVTA